MPTRNYLDHSQVNAIILSSAMFRFGARADDYLGATT